LLLLFFPLKTFFESRFGGKKEKQIAFEKNQQNNCFALYAAINGPLIHPVTISIHITNGDKMTCFSFFPGIRNNNNNCSVEATALTTTKNNGCRKKIKQLDS
jgi:hypothetical protein